MKNILHKYQYEYLNQNKMNTMKILNVLLMLMIAANASRVRDITKLTLYIDKNFNETSGVFEKDIRFPLSFNRNENTFGGILSDLPITEDNEYHKLLVEAEGFVYDYDQKVRGSEIEVIFSGSQKFSVHTGKLSSIELLIRDMFPPEVNEKRPPVILSIEVNPSMVRP